MKKIDNLNVISKVFLLMSSVFCAIYRLNSNFYYEASYYMYYKDVRVVGMYVLFSITIISLILSLFQFRKDKEWTNALVVLLHILLLGLLLVDYRDAISDLGLASPYGYRLDRVNNPYDNLQNNPVYWLVICSMILIMSLRIEYGNWKKIRILLNENSGILSISIKILILILSLLLLYNRPTNYIYHYNEQLIVTYDLINNHYLLAVYYLFSLSLTSLYLTLKSNTNKSDGMTFVISLIHIFMIAQMASILQVTSRGKYHFFPTSTLGLVFDPAIIAISIFTLMTFLEILGVWLNSRKESLNRKVKQRG